MKGELSDLPDDVLEDLEASSRELEKELGRYKRRVKQRYPSNSDIAEAIKRLSGFALVNPEEFPERVREALEREGFYTGLVTDERVWRIYESMVRRGALRDFLGVMGEG